ncbi:MAG: trigger factor [Verrucomicrobia bacterium]|nr:trigger factor [Verrucomicrobiota bacterium]
MEVIKKDIDQLNAELTIKISETDYKEQVNASLKNYRRQASLPGFRKGMVPMGMIRKMVGTNILAEEINKMLSDKLYQYINDEKLNILGNPMPKESDEAAIDWENQKDFEFTYELGIAPEVKAELSEKDKVEKYSVKVTDKMIDEQILEIAKRYGKMIDAEVSDEEDMLYGKFEELKGGKVAEDGLSNGTVLNIRTIDKSSNQKKFINQKVGDVIKIKPLGIAEEQYVAAWLGVDKKEVSAYKGVEFQFTIEKINRMSPAELNQEFFDKIYGKDSVKSKEEMSERLRNEMEASFNQNAEQLFEREVQDLLMKKAKLKLPDEFMKKWLMTANEKPLTKEQLEEEYDQYAEGIKWQLIENKIIRDNDIKVEREEIVNHTKGMIMQQLASMGQGDMEDSELTDTANRILENQEEARRLYDQMYQTKMRALFKEKVKVKEKEISYDDFLKLAEKKKSK